MDVENKLDVTNWFLAGHYDVRSCDFLELVATEFAVQGLEIDRAGVCWEADFRREGDRWEPYRFLGTEWQRVRDAARRQFTINKYRVLLTRAREGMILFVPRGDRRDRTRPPARYDAIADALRRAGVPDWPSRDA